MLDNEVLFYLDRKENIVKQTKNIAEETANPNTKLSEDKKEKHKNLMRNSEAEPFIYSEEYHDVYSEEQMQTPNFFSKAVFDHESGLKFEDSVQNVR